MYLFNKNNYYDVKVLEFLADIHPEGCESSTVFFLSLKRKNEEIFNQIQQLLPHHYQTRKTRFYNLFRKR